MSAESSPRRRRRCSPSLLSLVASIAQQHAQASPVPSFLCPSLSDVHLVRLPRHLPDKFQPAEDGFWRKEDTYTLYGSTICPQCKEDSTAVAEDNQIQAQSSSIGTSTTVVATGTVSLDAVSSAADTSTVPPVPSVFDVNNLPPGWKPPVVVKRTSLIIIVSMALTVVICIFMVACLLLRRARRKGLPSNVDLEMKMKRRKRKTLAADSGSLATTEDRTTQKIWARATARWKANLRYAARRRRGKRGIARSSQASSSMTSLNRIEPSRHPPPSLSIPTQQHLPPAYHRNDSDTSSIASGVPSMPSSGPSYPISAHVAIDEKELLAHMEGLASAPPSNEDPNPSGGSAPAWPDSEEEGLVNSRDDTDTAPATGSLSLFPPPPSKGKLPTSCFDYPYTLDFGVVGSEPESEPSAPPFEEADVLPHSLPSAPPIIPHDPSQDPRWDDDTLSDVYITEERRHSTSRCSPSRTETFTPPIHGPVNRDGRPPSYQP